MILKVVPLPTQQGLKFDIILPDYYVVTLEMDEGEVRAHGGISVRDVIETRIYQWLLSNDYDTETISIIFC